MEASTGQIDVVRESKTDSDFAVNRQVDAAPYALSILRQIAD